MRTSRRLAKVKKTTDILAKQRLNHLFLGQKDV